MTQIIASSKSGVNVLTATDPNDFIFHSQYNSFKILAQGTGSYTINAGSSNVTKSIAHGQSQKPFVFAFVKWADGLVGSHESAKKSSLVGFDTIYNVQIEVNGTNVIWTFTNSSASNESVNLAYYVCEAPAQN